MIPDWTARYIGIPYLDHGMSLTGVDCYGLVRMVMARELNVNLPDLRYQSSDDMDDASGAVEETRPRWRKLDKPVFGSVLLMRIAGYPVHVGLVLDDEFMLHCLPGHQTVLERYTGTKWRSRIDGAYVYDN